MRVIAFVLSLIELQKDTTNYKVGFVCNMLSPDVQTSGKKHTCVRLIVVQTFSIKQEEFKVDSTTGYAIIKADQLSKMYFPGNIVRFTLCIYNERTDANNSTVTVKKS